MAKINLSSPWVQFYHEVQAMFRDDSYVRVIFDEDNLILKLCVDDLEVAAALDVLMPTEKEFGNVTLKIEVVPANESKITTSVTGCDPAQLFGTAFRHNMNFSFVRTVYGIMTNPITYVVFRNEVVQYFTDSLGDAHGLRSTLAQDIAKEIFNPIDGVYFCTDVPDSETGNVLCDMYGMWP